MLTFLIHYAIIYIVNEKGVSYMANRITEEQKLQINQLYYEIGVKSRVAKIMGISASTVSKYIIPDWKPQEKRAIKKFEGRIDNGLEFIKGFVFSEDKQDYLWCCKLLTKEEWLELEELQEEIFI